MWSTTNKYLRFARCFRASPPQMAPKLVFSVLSGLKATFQKPIATQRKSHQVVSEGDEESCSITVNTAQNQRRASIETVQILSPIPKRLSAGATELFADHLSYSSSIASAETIITIRTQQTSPSTANMNAQNSDLLPFTGPQPVVIDLKSELAKTGRFISPLPPNPAAASLSRLHFKCHAKHASMKPSSNAYAPTPCTTCHAEGDVVLVACRCCYLRMCRRCAGLLSRSKDLEEMLWKLVEFGVWNGLDGQG